MVRIKFISVYLHYRPCNRLGNSLMWIDHEHTDRRVRTLPSIRRATLHVELISYIQWNKDTFFSNLKVIYPLKFTVSGKGAGEGGVRTRRFQGKSTRLAYISRTQTQVQHQVRVRHAAPTRTVSARKPQPENQQGSHATKEWVWL